MLLPKHQPFHSCKEKSSYARLKDEIDKCAPVCANCHRLLKHGYVDLPELILLPS